MNENYPLVGFENIHILNKQVPNGSDIRIYGVNKKDYPAKKLASAEVVNNQAIVPIQFERVQMNVPIKFVKIRG